MRRTRVVQHRGRTIVAVQRPNGQLVLSASDLNNFLECPHLIQLDLAVVEGRFDAPDDRTARTELIARKGDEHEAAYLQSLKAKGRQVVEIPRADGNIEAVGKLTL